ncbi:MAG: hypothetical protein WCS03_04160 [Bacteroidota bacterium]
MAVTGLIFSTFYSSKPEKKNIGLQLYSIRDSIMKNVPAAVAKVGKMGYKFVEPASPVVYFNKYPGRFILWHIKDEKEIGGSGKMDFAGIWAGAAKSGMEYGIVEVERYNFDEFTSCQMSIDFLNTAPYVVMPK